jgi:hypothetical protein
MHRKKVMGAMLGVAVLLMGGLFVGEGGAAGWEAVIATAAADYSSGAHSVATVDQVKKRGVMQRKIKNNLAPTISDITVAAHGEYFYRIERFNSDNIAKFSFKNPRRPLWQFSTMDAGDVESSNPHDMVFASDEKAYVLRFGSTKAWIVNPNATRHQNRRNSIQFKQGELDLSAYGDSDGVPEMHCGVIANGKLFIVLQRLDSDNGWVPSNTPYLAVFDAETNEEIDTGMDSGGLKGIPLPVLRPYSICYLEANNTVYVQGVGSWPGFGDPAYDYTGGIAAVDPETYAARMVLDDGTEADHPYGAISGMAIASPEIGYFVGYDGWGDNTLYRFNPTTGEVLGEVGQGLSHINIAGWDTLAGTPDRNGMLWICDATNGRILILDTVTSEVEEQLSTSLNPIKVVFMSP